MKMAAAGLAAMILMGSDLHGAPTSDQERLKNLEETVKDLDNELSSVKAQAAASAPGNTKFLLTGYAFTGFISGDKARSSFSAGFSPIFLWKLSGSIFFEGELNVSLENKDTKVELEYGQMSYILDDYVTVGAGKFLTPFAMFPERLHPAWINKLPDFPLPFKEDAGIVPFSVIGLQAHGAAAAGPTKVTYAFHLSNGPRLNTGADVPEDAGKLEFDNHTDNNNHKALGGRLGFFPIPELEIGYSALGGRVGGEGPFSMTKALLQAGDLAYYSVIEPLRGAVDAHVEWVWSHVDTADYGAGPFRNDRNGGYLQLAYRPSRVEQPVLKNLEAVARYDTLGLPNGDITEYQKRWTFGLDYWLGPSTALKAAYQNDRGGIGHVNRDAFLCQAVIGF